jgi:Neuraminidase (sialidase)
MIESKDGGETWENVEIITPESNASISAVTYSPNNRNKIQYISGTVFYSSSDGGRSWRTTELGLPARRTVSNLLISRENDDIIVLGVR